MFTRVVFLACLGGFLFGYDLGAIGGAMLGITSAFGASSAEQEAVVGAAKLGAFFGTYLGGATMLRYGRRRAIALQAAFFVAGPCAMAAAGGVGGLFIGRWVVGLGIGASAIVVPAYLAEIAPPSSRGAIVQVYEVMLTLGMLAAQAVNALLSKGGPGAWRWMLGLPAAPGALLLLSLLLLPESPKWLVMRGDLDLALTTLHTIISSKRGGGSSRARGRRPAHEGGADGTGVGGPPVASPALLPAAGGAAAAAAAGTGAAVEEEADAARAAGSVGPGARPHQLTAEDKALAEAEDELLWLWSSVQKEQAAGAELRRSGAAAAAQANGNGSGAGTGEAGALLRPCQQQQQQQRGHAVAAAAAPLSAFTLDEHEDAELAAMKADQQRQGAASNGQHTVHAGAGGSQQHHAHLNGSSAGSGPHASERGSSRKHWRPGGGGSGSNTAAAADEEEDTQAEQLLAPGTITSSSAALGQQPLRHASPAPGSAQQQPWQQQQQQQQQDGGGWLARWQRRLRRRSHLPTTSSSCSAGGAAGGPEQRPCEPGREASLQLTLAAMLRDVAAVACGPERRAFGIACCLAVFDQATASTAIINYAPLVLSRRLGVASSQDATLYPVAISLAKFVGVCAALLLVDRAGRKPLLVAGGLGCAAALAGAAGALLARSVPLFLAALAAFIFCFSASWAGLYWVVASELFSMGAKSPATSAATSLLFLTGAVTNFVFLSAVEALGAAAFLGFAGVAACSAAYVARCVPETKGRTQGEIQALLAPAGGSRGGDGGGSGGGSGTPGGAAGWQQEPGGRHEGAGSGAGGAARHGSSGLVELRQLLAEGRRPGSAAAAAGAQEQRQQQQQQLLPL